MKNYSTILKVSKIQIFYEAFYNLPNINPQLSKGR